MAGEARRPGIWPRTIWTNIQVYSLGPFHPTTATLTFLLSFCSFWASTKSKAFALHTFPSVTAHDLQAPLIQISPTSPCENGWSPGTPNIGDPYASPLHVTFAWSHVLSPVLCFCHTLRDSEATGHQAWKAASATGFLAILQHGGRCHMGETPRDWTQTLGELALIYLWG